MAATVAPLVWDFYRQIGNDPDVIVCGTAHYYDEQAQTLFGNSGLKTRLAKPIDGQWMEAEYSFPSEFINTTEWTSLSLDHPCMGALYLTGVDNSGNLVYMRYQYAADVSGVVKTVTHKSQADNPITQINATLTNVDNDWFSAESGLFQPGAKIKLSVRYGSGEAYPIGVGYMDDFQHDCLAQTVSLSARNTMGYHLSEASFGSDHDFSGLSHEVAARMLELAGVAEYTIQPGSGELPLSFDPKQTVLKGFETFGLYYARNGDNMPWELLELPTGEIVGGYADWLESYRKNGFYTFELGKGIMKRKTKKCADGAYGGVYATSKDSAGNDLVPVEVKIDNFGFWQIPAKKLYHFTPPEGWALTQADLQWWAELKAKELKYVGLGEDFTTPYLQPQIEPGDVAEITVGGEAVSLGIITAVTQTMGESGFRTQFSVDSGGEYTEVADGGVRSDTGSLNGYNRKQSIADLIRVVVGRGEK